MSPGGRLRRSISRTEAISIGRYKKIDLTGKTHDDYHCKPDGLPPAESLADEEREDTSRHAAEVVDGHDDTLERAGRFVEGLQPIRVGDDSGEDALAAETIVSNVPWF